MLGSVEVQLLRDPLDRPFIALVQSFGGVAKLEREFGPSATLDSLVGRDSARLASSLSHCELQHLASGQDSARTGIGVDFDLIMRAGPERNLFLDALWFFDGFGQSTYSAPSSPAA